MQAHKLGVRFEEDDPKFAAVKEAATANESVKLLAAAVVYSILGCLSFLEALLGALSAGLPEAVRYGAACLGAFFFLCAADRAWRLLRLRTVRRSRTTPSRPSTPNYSAGATTPELLRDTRLRYRSPYSRALEGASITPGSGGEGFRLGTSSPNLGRLASAVRSPLVFLQDGKSPRYNAAEEGAADAAAAAAVARALATPSGLGQQLTLQGPLPFQFPPPAALASRFAPQQQWQHGAYGGYHGSYVAVASETAASAAFAGAEDPKFADLLKRLKLDERMDGTVGRVRKLLARRVREFTGHFQWVVAELEARGISRAMLLHEQDRQPVLRLPGLATSTYNYSWTDIVHSVRQFGLGSAFVATNPNTGLLEDLIETYEKKQEGLKVTAWSDPAYVARRLRTLAEDNYIGGYRWDGGGRYHGREWSADDVHTPTDAELIMHMFICLGDEWLAREVRYPGDSPFTTRHCLENSPEVQESALWSRIAIVRANPRAPKPQYGVIADGEAWPVAPGKNNAFQTVALFLHAVAVKKRGYLSYNVSVADTLAEIEVGDRADTVATV